MKFAAFISIIVSVAVMFAACQGAIGPQGPKGDPGADGADGMPGTAGQQGPQGDAGIDALVARGGNTVATVWVNDKHTLVGTALTAEYGGPPEAIDVSEYFIGGAPDITYADSGVPDSSAPGAVGTPRYTAMVSAGMATFDLVDSDVNTAGVQPVAATSDDGGGLVSFIVTATDANSVTASKTIMVRRNVAPQASGSINLAIALGTQAVENPNEAGRMTLPMLNQFRQEISSAATSGTHFTDADFENLRFTAESSDTSVVTASPDGKYIVITGLAGSAATPPTITVKAIDSNGLTSTGSITITPTVTAAPRVAQPMNGPGAVVRADSDTRLVTSVGDFFSPGDGLTYTVKSSNKTVIAFTEAQSTVADNVVGTAANVGTSTITVTATDTLGQYAVQSFDVQVTNS